MKQKNTTYVVIPESREEQLEQFIRGSILGDGSIPRLSINAKNYRMCFGHGPKQLDYLRWKSEFLMSYDLHSGCITPFKSMSSRYKAGFCMSYHFKSTSHPIFTKFRNLYYQDHKILDYNDIQKMDEFALAIWFMDDGHIWYRKKRNPCMVFNTTGFTQDEVHFLINLLYSKWGINSSYLKTYNCIRITTADSPILSKIIQPYLHKSIDYKGVLYKEEELLES